MHPLVPCTLSLPGLIQGADQSGERVLPAWTAVRVLFDDSMPPALLSRALLRPQVQKVQTKSGGRVLVVPRPKHVPRPSDNLKVRWCTCAAMPCALQPPQLVLPPSDLLPPLRCATSAAPHACGSGVHKGSAAPTLLF